MRMARSRRHAAADRLRPARLVRGGDGPGPALAVMGLRTRRGAGPQRRPVFGGLRRGRVQPRGRSAADGRARPPVRQFARGRPDGRGVHRRRAGGGPDRRVPESVGGRLQRCQHRAVRTRAGSGAGGGQADGATVCGATGWTPATRSTRRCWIRSSTNSSHTRTGSSSRAPQRTLVCNRTGAALGRSAKLDGAYWRRHARQPVEFAKSVRTLSDLQLHDAAGDRPATGAHRRGHAGMA